MTRVRLGVTLPSFVRDPEVVLTVARRAEEAGLDGVFVFDHLFRTAADGTRRPALEASALIGAVAVATSRIAIGALVWRASTRPSATLAAVAETVGRLAPGRAITAIGAGDSESRAENTSFGLGFGTLEDRVTRLRESVRACRDRGTPVWVGGHVEDVRDVAAAEADGWNCWGGEVASFAERATAVRARARRTPFACSWGGLAVVGDDDSGALETAHRLDAGPGTLVGGPATIAHRLSEYATGGADWLIVGPIDSRDPANAERLGANVLPLLN